ncbi:MAG: PilZ domain-containing protein [Candidatus Aminicenantes bacterium]|nr:PilZ domain-containing protein [Candidatus Aminicenantes bacterium]
MTEEKREARTACLTEVTFDHEGMTFSGRITDLSAGGFYVDTINPLPVGALIVFRFVLPGMSAEGAVIGEARVAWQQPFQGMGVRYDWLSDEDKDKLIRFIQGGS